MKRHGWLVLFLLGSAGVTLLAPLVGNADHLH